MAEKYPVGEPLRERIESDFTYHRPHGDQPERYEQIRYGAKMLAHTFVNLAPSSREL
jgi:hypothetical protein